ncbi:Coq4 family protein [Nocardia sp. NPDC020380]|uniref:Coq4 family protein n=1 Tax=Nocardia sp. NPDC020380 TaxID=3364309 RepID=UPI00378EE8B7
MAIATESPSRIDGPERIQWLRGFRSLSGLFEVKFRHDRVFEMFMYFAGPALRRAFEQVCSDPDGQRLLQQKPNLLALLDDDEYLASLPPDSLGAAYRDFLNQHRLDAGVFPSGTVIQPIIDQAGWSEDFGYMVQRGTALHDMFHTLGGYGPDGGGELGNLGFHHGQLDGSWFTGALSALIIAAMPGGTPWRKYRYWREAVRRGRRAGNLMAAPYEELLTLPLDEVRRRLNVAPTPVAHPAGHFFSAAQIPFVKRSGKPFEPWIFQPVRTCSQE